MVLDGQTACTEDLDCEGCIECIGCAPCQPNRCLTAFYDNDRDGYGSGAVGVTTVCNRINPSSPPFLSFAFNDCDDANPDVFPGSSVCSPTDPNVRITCGDNASLKTETCTNGACSNGQCGGGAGGGP